MSDFISLATLRQLFLLVRWNFHSSSIKKSDIENMTYSIEARSMPDFMTLATVRHLILLICWNLHLWFLHLQNLLYSSFTKTLTWRIMERHILMPQLREVITLLWCIWYIMFNLKTNREQYFCVCFLRCQPKQKTTAKWRLNQELASFTGKALQDHHVIQHSVNYSVIFLCGVQRLNRMSKMSELKFLSVYNGVLFTYYCINKPSIKERALTKNHI